MKKRLLALVSAAAALSVSAMPSAIADSVRPESQRYIAGEVGEVGVSCPLKSQPSIGGACFEARYFTERQVRVTIDDDQGWLVGGQIGFFDVVGRTYGYKLFCGSTTAEIPWGATDVLVSTNGIGALIDARWGCFLNSHPATSGTIYADFITPLPSWEASDKHR